MKEKNEDLRGELGAELVHGDKRGGNTMIDDVGRERKNINGAEEESGEVICVTCGFVHLYFSKGGKVIRQVDVIRKRRNGQYGAILQSSGRSLILLLLFFPALPSSS